jgi:hypothetical protein
MYRAFRMHVDYVKEEKWLNAMSQKGYHFVNYNFFRYLFEKDETKTYTYRIELLDNMPSNPKSQAYLDFLQETNITVVSSYFRWVYLRKESKEGTFELHSDFDSKIQHYIRILTLQGIVGLMNFVIGFNNVGIGYVDKSFNLSIGHLNLVIAFILGYFCAKNYTTIRRLKKEKQISES